MTEPQPIPTGDALLRLYERAYGPFVHMSQQEKAIWLRFLVQGGTTYQPFYYDVRLGDGLQMPAGSSSFAVKSAFALTTKRLDVLFFDKGTAVIVEVKVRAGASAIGQLITYRDLFKKTPDWSGPIGMLLVTDELQPDMSPVYESAGIRVTIVGL